MQDKKMKKETKKKTKQDKNIKNYIQIMLNDPKYYGLTPSVCRALESFKINLNVNELTREEISELCTTTNCLGLELLRINYSQCTNQLQSRYEQTQWKYSYPFVLPSDKPQTTESAKFEQADSPSFKK